MDAPAAYPTRRFLHPLGRYGPNQEHQTVATSVIASGTWPAANRALYFPIKVPWRFDVRRVFVVNGATVNGNFDFGIYSPGGSKIYSTGSTAQAGTSAFQYVTVATRFILPPGWYYFALASSSATATFQRVTGGANTIRMTGCLEEASAFPLPATMTPAAISGSAYYPLAGVTSLASGF